MMSIVATIVAAIVFAGVVCADDDFYAGSAVEMLTPSNFDSKVLSSDSVWIVEFYAPWCGHCKNLAPEWKKAANALKGVVKIAAVNADEHRSLGSQYGVQGFPTIKIFGANKKSPTDYQGERNAKSIIAAAMKEVQKLVDGRSGGSSSSSSSSSSGSGSGGSKSGGGKDAVVTLTDSNFNSLVMGDDDLWLVEFFAPWCGHCKNLAPEWEKVAKEYQGQSGVKIAAVDATVETTLAQKYEIKGYPTIKVFRPGKKDHPEDYQGGRSASEISSFVKSNMNIPAPEVYELTGPDVFEKVCAKSLCLISFLPHILDSKASGRKEYLATLKKVANQHKTTPTTYLWTEAMLHPELEAALNVGGAGYPALVGVNVKKSIFVNSPLAFDEKRIGEFLTSVTLPGSNLAKNKITGSLPTVKNVPKWDGLDGKPPVEEDYDL